MAGTVLDEFVLAFSLDPSKFTRGQREVMDGMRRLQEDSLRQANATEFSTKRALEGMMSLKRGVLGIATAVLGAVGIEEFTNFIVKLDATTARAAKTMNMSVESLSAWQGAIEQVGGSAESATAGLSGLSQATNMFLINPSSFQALALFNRLGVSLFNANHQLRDSGELWLDLARAVEGMDPGKARAFLSMVPGANADLINFALLGSKAMREYLDVNREIEGTTRESAQAALEYQREIGRLERAFASLGRTLLTPVLPKLSQVATAMTDAFKTVKSGRIFSWREMLHGLITGEVPAAAPSAAPSPGAAASTQGTGSRGDRNNNPGNIEYGAFAKAHGAIGSDGRFAIFPTREAGESAMESLLRSRYQGLTISQIQQKWVGNPDSNYAGSMASATGTGVNAVPNLNDPDLLHKLMLGMTHGEGTHLGAGVAAMNYNTSRGGDTSTSATHNNVNIVIHAESDQVAGAIGDTLRRTNLTAPLNTGQQ